MKKPWEDIERRRMNILEKLKAIQKEMKWLKRPLLIANDYDELSLTYTYIHLYYIPWIHKLVWWQ
jgi:hypothetical protein